MTVASAGPYASLHLAPDSTPRQQPHNSVFHRPDALPAAQSTASKHWRQIVLRPTRHNMGHFGDVSTSQSLGLVGKVTKPNTKQARIRQSKEMYYNKKYTQTRSSAIAEGPRDASCQLKSCQLPRNSAETLYDKS